METVARRAGVGKASVYLRWSTKEALLTDAVTMRLGRVTDVDTGTLAGDLVQLATQMLDVYAGEAGRAALRLPPGGAPIPRGAENHQAKRAGPIPAPRPPRARGERPRGPPPPAPGHP